MIVSVLNKVFSCQDKLSSGRYHFFNDQDRQWSRHFFSGRYHFFSGQGIFYSGCDHVLVAQITFLQ